MLEISNKFNKKAHNSRYVMSVYAYLHSPKRIPAKNAIGTQILKISYFLPYNTKELSEVIDMIKDLAVELPLNDVQKREVIRDKLGFDVDFAVEMERSAKEDNGADHNGKRRTSVPKVEEKAEEKAPARRVVKIIEDK